MKKQYLVVSDEEDSLHSTYKAALKKCKQLNDNWQLDNLAIYKAVNNKLVKIKLPDTYHPAYVSYGWEEFK